MEKKLKENFWKLIFLVIYPIPLSSLIFFHLGESEYEKDIKIFITYSS